MKLILLLAVAGLSSGAKLDNTYLPPSHAQTSGGSGHFLQVPGSPNDYQRDASIQPVASTLSTHLNSAYTALHSPQPNFAQNGNFPTNGHPVSQFSPSSNNYQNSYSNPSGQVSPNGNGYQNSAYGNQMPQERAQAAFERNAKILRFDNQNDGVNFAYSYETENGISAEEHGVADWQHGKEAEGGFSYTGDDGQVYSVRYTAGLNGFVPQGDHLPTPPPIPEEIQAALEKNARDEAAGIYDDGSYHEGKYDSGDHSNQHGNTGYNYNQGGSGNQNQYQPAVELLNDDAVVTNNALIRDNFKQPASFGNQGPFGNQNNQGNFGPSNQAHRDVTQAYLPPFERQTLPSSRNQGSNQFGRQSQLAYNQGPSFGNQKPFGNQGFRNQGPRNQSPGSHANQAYLPPFENQRSGNQRLLNNQTPSFGNQSPRSHSSGATNNAYLPPK